ncbi:hypothetical protein MPER_13222 [Moniliophthora perniciosa FA553]|nr:hypothetical protein MPER_13222 [Moniliophthora perniciosa FA553]
MGEVMLLQNSPLLLGLPWASNFVARGADRLDLLPGDLKVMDLAFKRDNYYEKSDFRDVMDGNIVMEKRNRHLKVMPVLFGLRLLDIASYCFYPRDGDTNSVEISPPFAVSRSPIPSETLVLRGLKGLSNQQGWPGLLRQLDEAFHELPASSGSIAEETIQRTPSQELLLSAFKQLQSVIDCNTKLFALKALHNMEMAAFAINFLLQGNADFPEKTDDLVKALLCRAREEGITPPALKKTDTVNRLRQPLFLALSVSPLILFSNVSPLSANLDRLAMIRAWFHMGNQKPASLVAVEIIVWKKLFAMARGKVTARAAMEDILHETRPLLLCSDADKFFFDPASGASLPLPLPFAYTPSSEPDSSSAATVEEIVIGEEGLHSPVKRKRVAVRVVHLGSDFQPPRVTTRLSDSRALDVYANANVVKSKEFVSTDDELTSDEESAAALVPAFDATRCVKRIRGKEYLLFTPDGRSTVYRPSFYTRTEVLEVESLISRANEYQLQFANQELLVPILVDDIAIQQTASKISAATKGTAVAGVSVMPYKEYKSLDEKKQLEPLFSERHIVVTGCPLPRNSKTFDEKNLEYVGNLSALRQIHDLSLACPAGVRDDYVVRASFMDMLAEASKGDRGIILHCLDLPNTKARCSTSSLSTSEEAWAQTLDLPGFPRYRSEYPTNDTFWHLVAVGNAWRTGHVVPNGFNTEILVRCGAKLVFLATPSDGNLDKHAHLAMYRNFKLDLRSDVDWNVMGLLLLPGDRIIFRAGTPHYVVTLTPSICHGSHFYTASTMQDSCWSLIHTFIRFEKVSNTHRLASFDLLHRIVAYWKDRFVNDFPRCLAAIPDTGISHVPDVLSIDGLMHILALANVMEFGTLLLPQRYVLGVGEEVLKSDFDGNPALSKARKDFRRSRSLASDLVMHLQSLLVIERKDGTDVVEVPLSVIWRSSLVQQAVAFLMEAEEFESNDRPSAVVKEALYSDFSRKGVLLYQIRSIMSGGSVSFPGLPQLTLAGCDTFRWAFKDHFYIVRLRSDNVDAEAVLDARMLTEKIGTTAVKRKRSLDSLPEVCSPKTPRTV